jgi:aminoglycoside 2'-N-acetyltransferase I
MSDAISDLLFYGGGVRDASNDDRPFPPPTPIVASERLDTVAPAIRQADTSDLSPAEVDTIRALMDVAFGDDEEERFTEDDWVHAIGGRHFLLEIDGSIVGHASVVHRELEVDGRSIRTGYVEAVAIDPTLHGRGLGSVLMNDVNAHIRTGFELGALGTGRQRFYERLGWRTWQGPSSVRTPDGDRRTPDDDGYILVLEWPTSPIKPLDLHAPISCDWRAGDVW